MLLQKDNNLQAVKIDTCQIFSFFYLLNNMWSNAYVTWREDLTYLIFKVDYYYIRRPNIPHSPDVFSLSYINFGSLISGSSQHSSPIVCFVHIIVISLSLKKNIDWARD